MFVAGRGASGSGRRVLPSPKAVWQLAPPRGEVRQAESSAHCVRRAAAGHLEGWRVLGAGSKPGLFLESPRSAGAT